MTGCVTPQDWAKLTVMWAGGYSCMPYMAPLPNGDIVASLTVSESEEGATTQRVIVLRSTDGGHTWTEGAEIEPSAAPESSWGMPRDDATSGALYLFYLYNYQNVRLVPNSGQPGGTPRADSIGRVCWKISRDGGISWGPRVECPPLPPKAIDLRNPFTGKKRLLWTCGHPIAAGGKLFLGFSKMGTVKNGNMFVDTELFLLRFDSLPGSSIGPADAPDATPRVTELPRGKKGIRGRGQQVGEEPSPVVFDDGVVNLVFRTTTGKLGEAWSMDGGQTFDVDWARRSDGVTVVCQPRAKAAQFLLPDGRLFLWHHNNTWPGFGKHRNPVWYSIGERSGPRVRWGLPHALCYDTDPATKITYPSLIVYGEDVLISATDKAVAKIMKFPLSRL